jgi:hypothetical protein
MDLKLPQNLSRPLSEQQFDPGQEQRHGHEHQSIGPEIGSYAVIQFKNCRV